MLTNIATGLKCAVRGDIVDRSLRMAMVVGTVLAVSTPVDRLWGGGLTALDGTKVVCAYCVPYAVSTYASVSAILNNQGTW